MGMSEYLKKRQEYILNGRPLPEKKKYSPIAKKSQKRIEKEKEQKEIGGDSELDLFFEAMRKRLKGKCLFCNSGTTWKNDELWRIAVAHLLPKAKFKSVATNSENWVELCWNCHTEFDSAKITWELLKDSKEWDIIREKLFTVLPLVHEEEKKNKLYSRIEQLVYS